MNTESNEPQLEAGEAEGLSRLMEATVEDVEATDINIIFTEKSPGDYYNIHRMFTEASRASEQDILGKNFSSANVLNFASAVTSMFLKEGDPNEPFGPFAVMGSRRTAISSDFRPKVDVLVALSEVATHPLVKARCADLAWLLDRKRKKQAQIAIDAYVDAAKGILEGVLSFDINYDTRLFNPEAIKFVTRALQVGRGSRKQGTDVGVANAFIVDAFREVVEKCDLGAVVRLARLCLSYGLLSPGEIAHILEEMMGKVSSDSFFHLRVEVWRLISRAYGLERKTEDQHRCASEAAEELVRHAASNSHSAMVGSCFLMDAIKELQNIPGKKDRRNEIKSQLVNLQLQASGEMSVFSYELDLREQVDLVVDQFSRLSRFDQLIEFGLFDRSPEIRDLVEAATSQIKEHPLSSIFSAIIMDRDGKVIERAEGGLSPDGPPETAIKHKISQNEGFRRQIVTAGGIDVARQVILETFNVSTADMWSLLQHSPFVPSELRFTYSHGFTKFFQGDYISALYILTPLLEASIKHVLKSLSVDVSLFDSVSEVQEDRTISSIFDNLRDDLTKIFSDRIVENIYNVFLSKFGPHLRHSVAHGLLTDGDPFAPDAIYACWLIYHLCIIPLASVREQLRAQLGDNLERTASAI